MHILPSGIFEISRNAVFDQVNNHQNNIAALCTHSSANAELIVIGKSEQARDIFAIRLGKGPIKISLLSGSHSDEPVGTETLSHFIQYLIQNAAQNPHLFEQYTFHILPHLNPDGAVHNQKWIAAWPDLRAYLLHAFRELPGRDVEFGYPDMRLENIAASDYLQKHAPFDLHMSLHGMGFSEGAMLLIERSWIEKTDHLRKRFVNSVHGAGLGLHAHDRHGEKGFTYIGPGFTTTPESPAMRQFFLEKNDKEMANKFHQNSMEFVRSLGGNPLCLVTELPLFCINKKFPDHAPGYPVAYLRFNQEKANILAALQKGQSIESTINEFNIEPVPLHKAMTLQLQAIDAALEIIHDQKMGN